MQIHPPAINPNTPTALNKNTLIKKLIPSKPELAGIASLLKI